MSAAFLRGVLWAAPAGCAVVGCRRGRGTAGFSVTPGDQLIVHPSVREIFSPVNAILIDEELALVDASGTNGFALEPPVAGPPKAVPLAIRLARWPS